MNYPNPLSPIMREAYENGLVNWLFGTGAINPEGGKKFHFQKAYPEFEDYPAPSMYFNGRNIQSDPYWMKITADLLIDELLKVGAKFNHIAGIANGAIPVAITTAIKLNVSHLWVLKEAKAYGTGNPIEGFFNKGESVMTYEDVFSTGDSTIVHMEKLRSAGLKAQAAVGLLNYNIGSNFQFNEEGISYYSLFTIQRLMDIGVLFGLVKPWRAVVIVDYFETLRPLIEPVIAKKRAEKLATQQ